MFHPHPKQPKRKHGKRPADAEERAHLERVAALPCIVCGAWPVHVHHLRTRPDGQKYGAGVRATHYETIPLCPTHHLTGPFEVAFHAGERAWERIHGTELELLARVTALLKNQEAA